MLELWQLDHVVTSYEALSDEDRANFRDKVYNYAKANLDFKKKAEEKDAEQENNTPKN